MIFDRLGLAMLASSDLRPLTFRLARIFLFFTVYIQGDDRTWSHALFFCRHLTFCQIVRPMWVERGVWVESPGKTTGESLGGGSAAQHMGIVYSMVTL